MDSRNALEKFAMETCDKVEFNGREFIGSCAPKSAKHLQEDFLSSFCLLCQLGPQLASLRNDLDLAANLKVTNCCRIQGASAIVHAGLATQVLMQLFAPPPSQPDSFPPPPGLSREGANSDTWGPFRH